MSDAYIIEIAEETAGIVVRQQSDTGYRFHAALPKYFPLDGRVFAGPRDAERAAIAHFGRKRRSSNGAHP